MAATIDQVAKRAGVSKATVSRVLNDSKPVREETRLRVMDAVRELDFKPNPAARSLVYKKSRTLGVVVTDIANLFVSVLVKGIEEIAYSNNYNIFICNSHASAKKELELLMMLRDKRVDGIIFLTSRIKEDHKAFFKSSQLPIALVNVGYDDDNVVGIRIDNHRAAYDMTSYFINKGFERIGMIRAALDDIYTGRDRFFGYCQALEDHNIPYRDELVRTAALEAIDGYRAASEMCKNGLNLQALFVACDLMAFGAIKALIDHGLKVPEDIEVAGFDDVPMATYYHPALTTVRQPIEDMGRVASEKLINLIEGKGGQGGELVLPHQIIFRDSTSESL